MIFNFTLSTFKNTNHYYSNILQDCLLSKSRAKPCSVSDTWTQEVHGQCGATGVCRAKVKGHKYIYPNHPECTAERTTSSNQSSSLQRQHTLGNTLYDWILLLSQLGFIFLTLELLGAPRPSS